MIANDSDTMLKVHAGILYFPKLLVRRTAQSFRFNDGRLSRFVLLPKFCSFFSAFDRGSQCLAFLRYVLLLELCAECFVIVAQKGSCNVEKVAP